MENLPDNRDNPVDDKGNWTIKGFPAEVRKQAAEAAAKRGESMGVWAARAMTAQINLERGDRVEMPSDKPRPEGLTGDNSAGSTANPLDLAVLAAAMQAAAAVAVASGKPVPRDSRSQYNGAVVSYLRAARGLPKVELRRPRVPTVATIEAE